MKNLFFLFLTFHYTISVSAQTKFPYDSVSRQVVYKQSFKVKPKLKTEEVYATVQKWFSDSAKFTKMNIAPPVDNASGKKMKAKAETENLYANPRPLQALDPAGGKMNGMGIIQYYGGSTNAIRLLFIKYDIYMETKGGMVAMSVGNIHYFHYNPSTYKSSVIYSFAGKPCDEVGTIESLIGCETFHTEFSNLALFYNKEVNRLFTDFKNLLKEKKILYDGKVANTPASAKNKTKTPAKKPLSPAPKK
jgi:hypothetical protein